MEKYDLKKLWNSTKQEAAARSKEELVRILDSKAKRTVNRFLLVSAIAGIISSAVIIFLVITALHRKDDIWYVLNNFALGTLTIISLLSALYSWKRLNETKYSLPLKKLLEKNIATISLSLKGWHRAVSILIIPVLYVLLVMSINVYFSGMSYAGVLSSEESLTALLAGLLVGLPVSFYVENKIHKYHLKNLNEFEKLYEQLREAEQ